MSQGHIQRRGRASWRIKYDITTDGGPRRTRYVTLKGTRRDAQAELTRLLHAEHTGMGTDPSAITVAEHLNAWLDGAHGLSGKTVERYRQLASQQIIPPPREYAPAKAAAGPHRDLASNAAKGWR
jgi:hypothetical protein